jgi:diguanylate cyclase (GGDEF)-like protein
MLDGVSDEDAPYPSIRYAEDDEADVASGNETVVGELLARARAPSEPCFVVVAGHQSAGRIHRLRDGMVIGRSIGCDVILQEEGVSRRHARVHLSGEGTVRLEDLGSRNGIFQAGKRVASATLQDGQRVQLGDASLALLMIEGLDETVRRNLLDSANEDQGTRLPVRRQVMDHLARELAVADRLRTPLTVLVVAIDGYRSLVDAHGASAGHFVLRRTATIIVETAQREELVVGRYAEDMLAVVLPDTASDDARVLSEYVRKGVGSAIFVFDGADFRTSVSIGIGSAGGRSCDELLSAAENGAYAAKIAGGDRVHV